ncbi:hypothetical protein RHGRI_018871 [Rhododendron griersonianum]|uniref:Uncharacterized protein n=1 Tax=Rhododendron griersonianum TaxID=479676 RepID=A0AAV6K3A7_9ERIC|nr:hypothetical protein RHGRI_018871 [Rhododendron griersonianum]
MRGDLNLLIQSSKKNCGSASQAPSLTMEKMLTSAQLEAFHSEYRLPARLLLCLIKHHVHCQRHVRLNMEELALSHEDPSGLSLY